MSAGHCCTVSSGGGAVLTRDLCDSICLAVMPHQLWGNNQAATVQQCVIAVSFCLLLASYYEWACCWIIPSRLLLCCLCTAGRSFSTPVLWLRIVAGVREGCFLCQSCICIISQARVCNLLQPASVLHMSCIMVMHAAALMHSSTAGCKPGMTNERAGCNGAQPLTMSNATRMGSPVSPVGASMHPIQHRTQLGQKKPQSNLRCSTVVSVLVFSRRGTAPAWFAFKAGSIGTAARLLHKSLRTHPRTKPHRLQRGRYTQHTVRNHSKRKHISRSQGLDAPPCARKSVRPTPGREY